MASAGTATTGGYVAYDYVGLLRRRWWILVVGTAIGGLLGLLVAGSVPKVYSSSTSVLVQPTGIPALDNSSSGARSSGGVNIDNENQVITSTTVGSAAKNLLKTTTDIPTLLKNVTVTVPANTAVLTITFADQTPEAAQAGSHAFAQAYLDTRLATVKAAIASQSTQLTTQATALQTQLRAVISAGAAALASSPEKAIYDAQRVVLLGQLQSVQNQLVSLSTTPTSSAVIISDANVPTDPTAPVKVMYLASGLLVGFVLALALAALLQWRDRKVRSARSLAPVAVPVLADVVLPRRNRRIAIIDETAAGARSFGLARTMVVSRMQHGRLVVAVMAVSAGNGSGVVSASLSDSLARGGRRVVHIGGDASSPAPALLGARTGPGLAEALAGVSDAEAVWQRTGTTNRLIVIPPGELLDDLAPQLASDAMAELVDDLRLHHEVIVMEGPDLTGSPDSYAVSLAADVTILVVERGRTSVDDVQDVVSQLHRLGAPVLGIVLISETTGTPAVRDGAAQQTPHKRDPELPTSSESYWNQPTLPPGFDPTAELPEDGDEQPEAAHISHGQQ
jgi:Mrp family chromosome partitioning ATPase